MKFVAIEKLCKMHDGYRKSFSIGRSNLLLFQHDGQIHVVENVCPHAGAPLDKARIRGGQITCPWHGMAFDIATGHAASCGLSLVKYQVTIEDQSVGVLWKREDMT